MCYTTGSLYRTFNLQSDQTLVVRGVTGAYTPVNSEPVTRSSLFTRATLHGSTMSTDKCPVDKNSLGGGSCPVDHNTRSTWAKILPHTSDTLSSSESASQPTSTNDVPGSLSTSREVSSIPRNGNENWVYPSEAQFFAAMARKNHDPQAPDMKVIVPIHNAVNERAWSHIREWEAGRGGDRCGGVRLVSFKGKPGEPSPKARILTLLG
jgi:cytochrome c heme-lyase